jgi:chemotaxis protein MotB
MTDDDDFEVPRRRGGRSGLVAFVVIASLGAGAYAAHLYEIKVPRVKAEAEKAEVAGKLAACEKTREGEKASREASQKEADAAAAELGATRGELEELRREKAETEKRLALFKAITDKFRKMIDSGKLTVVMRHGRMVVKLPASVLFASASADLSKEGQTALTEVAHILRQFPDRRFEVAGHTDNLPLGPPSPFKNNLELSAARAVTVANYLINGGVQASRLSAAGYSEHQPVASNSRESGRQENRRIEIALLPNLSELPQLSLDADGGAPAGDAGK